MSSVPPLYLGMRWSMVVFSSGSGLPHLAQTPPVFSRIMRFIVCFFCLSVLKVPPQNVFRYQSFYLYNNETIKMMVNLVVFAIILMVLIYLLNIFTC